VELFINLLPWSTGLFEREEIKSTRLFERRGNSPSPYPLPSRERDSKWFSLPWSTRLFEREGVRGRGSSSSPDWGKTVLKTRCGEARGRAKFRKL
jgi:hypothetical protein